MFLNTSANTVGVGTNAPASKFDVRGTMQVGLNDTGYDVQFFGDAAGAAMIWDTSADSLLVRGATADAAGSSGRIVLQTAQVGVADGDILGRLDFQAPLETQGGDGALVSAAIWAEADATFTATVNNTELVFATGASETAAEKVRITSDGKVGIGSAAPGYMFTVAENRAANWAAEIVNDASDGAGLMVEAGDQSDCKAFKVTGGSTEVLTVKGDGKVGIGTTAPNYTLQIGSTYRTCFDSDGTVGTLQSGKGAMFGYHNATSAYYIQPEEQGVAYRNLALCPTGANVGIGSTAPAQKLAVVQTASATGMYVNTTVAGEVTAIFKGGGTGAVDVFTCQDSGGNVLFRQMQNGNTVLGRQNSTAPWGDTSGAGTIRAHSGVSGVENTNLSWSSASADTGHAMCYLNAIDGANDNRYFQFYRSGTAAGAIKLDGTTAVTYETTSDYRLKENIALMTGSIDRLKSLKPSDFNFIAEPDRECEGFIAHELDEYVPHAVSGQKDAVWPEELYKAGDEIPEGKSIGDVKNEEKINPQGVDLSRLTPLLTSALQEAITKIETLETKVKALEDA